MEKQTLFWLFVAIFAITAVITLLGITGVIKTIKEKYLNTLFTALILEVIAAVLLLFQGFSFDDRPVDYSALIARAGFAAPKTIELQEEFIKEKLEATLALEELTLKNEALQASLSKVETELAELKGNTTRYEQNFYSDIIKLNEAIDTYIGGSINIGFQPDQKEGVYQLLVKIFAGLGKIKDGDEIYTSDQVINKSLIRKIYADFRSSYGREVLDDTQVYIDEFDVSQMVKYNLEYRKIQPLNQALEEG